MSEMKRRGSDSVDNDDVVKRAKADDAVESKTETQSDVAPTDGPDKTKKDVSLTPDSDKGEEKKEEAEETKPKDANSDEAKPEAKPEDANSSESKSDAKPEVPKPAPTKTVGGFSAFSSGSGFGGFSGFGTKSALGSTSTNDNAKKSNPWSEKKEESTSEDTPESDDTKKAPVSSVFLNGDKPKATGSTILDKEQKVVTGEEEEDTEYSQRVKIYAFKLKDDKSGWKERGTGSLKINVDANGRRRLVMRADGVLRVALNLPLVKNMTVSKGFKSSLASDKFIRISGLEEGDAYQFAFKCASEEAADDLYDEIEKALP